MALLVRSPPCTTVSGNMRMRVVPLLGVLVSMMTSRWAAMLYEIINMGERRRNLCQGLYDTRVAMNHGLLQGLLKHAYKCLQRLADVMRQKVGKAHHFG